MLKNIIKRCLRKDALLYLLLLLLIIIIVFSSLLPAKILEYIVNGYLNNENRVFKALVIAALFYLLIIILNGLFDFIKQILLIRLGLDFTKEIRLQMAEKLSKLQSIYFVNHASGIIQSRFMNDVEAINTLFTDGIISMIIDLFKIIGIIIAMFLYSYQLGILTIIIIPIVFLISHYFKKKMFKANLAARRSLGNLNNHLVETFTNERMIKIYSKEPYMTNVYESYLNDNYNASNKVSFYDSIYSPIIQVLTSLVIMLVVLLSNGELKLFSLSVGALAGAIQYISALFQPVENLGIELQTIQKARSGITRVNEFFKAKEELPKNNALSLETLKIDKPIIKFTDLSFSYDDNQPVLNNLSLVINPLERFTFIGRTGVGKTTLFKLIMGMLEPCEGKITINNNNVLSISNEMKYRIFGYVDQSFKPITGTIMDNITMKNKDIAITEVEKALETVGILTKINSFSDKLNTMFNPTLFSQGELQLLSISRAIVANPPILLLDEMTASLDSITEDRVLKAIEDASKNRTIISITHRLSSCYSSDKIVYLEKGRIKKIFTREEFINDPLIKKLINE